MAIRVGKRKLPDFRIEKADFRTQFRSFRKENIQYPFTAVFKAAVFVYVRNIFIFV